ncbi:DUF1569 domain-containing protein [uncultured Polaribacter sp.]|uniref:DUF1569 domain-containing protein n=1 Tax=uncultured Polaribacter sp. TaxID=174711 RepID=UPI0026330473|nr:DUF1569 domain-containing protein [uncultured Polaribacter sp.]
MKVINTVDLETKINLLERSISKSDLINTTVSKVNVAWHIDHSLKVINAVVKTMQNSDPKLYKDNFTFLGKILLLLKYFPKGKAQAPKHVKPPEIILKSAIIDQLETAKQNLSEIVNLDENAFFKHPLFGNINKKRVVRFLNVHTNHHLKIIKNILN